MELSATAQSLKLGTYEHFKGQRYKVLGVAKHSETWEDMVLYEALYGDHHLTVRPLAMFLEEVEVNGQSVPRFRFIE